MVVEAAYWNASDVGSHLHYMEHMELSLVKTDPVLSPYMASEKLVHQ